MVEVLEAHLISLLFGLLFCFIFVYARIRNLKYATKVDGISTKLNLVMPSLFEETVDIQFGTENPKLKGSAGVLVLLAKEFNKGYDLMHITQKEVGSLIPPHKHFRANELFYVLEGEIKVYICDRKKSTDNCINNCEQYHTMKAGDWCFVKKRHKHCVSVVKPAKYLIIAKPPLFSRIGKFYESFRKTK